MFRKKSPALVIGAIVTLGVLSLAAVNLILTARNNQLQKSRHESLLLLQAGQIKSRLETELLLHPEPAGRFRALQEFMPRSGLMALQISDMRGQTIFNQATVPMPRPLLDRMQADAIRQANPRLDQMAMEEHILQRAEEIPVMLVRWVTIPVPGAEPVFLAFVARSPATGSMNSLEQLAVLCQTVIVFCLVAILWFLVRRWIRPHEDLIRDMKKNVGSVAAAAASDEVSVLVGSFKDIIRQLREKEQQLEQLHREARKRADYSEKYARDMLAGLPLSVLSFDSQGMFLDCNPAAESLLSRNKVALKNLTYRSVFSGSEEICQQLGRFFQDRPGPAGWRTTLRLPSGEDRMIKVGISGLVSPEAVFAGAVLVLEDVTEQNRLEHRMRNQENLARLGEMSAGIAHEFKNSLATISGYAQMLLGNARLGGEQKRAAALVQEVEVLARIISEFLEYARPLPAEKKPLALDILLKSLAEEFKEQQPGVELDLNLLPVRVAGEEHLLRKAVQNLWLNAVQSMEDLPEGTARKIVTSLEVLSGAMVSLQITDTGRGMDPATRSRLFTPFFTTRTGGTGLGLAVVQKIVTIHDGFIHVASEPGQGTTVELTLPAVPAEGMTAG